MEYVYSIDDENFNDDLWEVIQEAVDMALDVDGKVELFTGIKVVHTHGHFISSSHIVDLMRDYARDMAGDLSCEYLVDVSPGKLDDLNDVLADWFNKNARQPEFYTVAHSEPRLHSI